VTAPAWQLARVELAAGLAGLRLFAAAVAVGAALLAAVWVAGALLLDAFDRNGRAILGGDAEIEVGATPLDGSVVDALGRFGTVSRVVDLRSTVRRDGRAATVELRAVDGAYPLYGRLAVEGVDGAAIDPAAALAPAGGVPGAIVDPALTARLDAQPGDVVRLGETEVRLAGLLRGEPDRLGAGAFMVGPRVIVALDTLAAAGLLGPGALADWRYRLRFEPPIAFETFAARAAALEPEVAWDLRRPDDAADRLRRIVARTTTFLGIAGVMALAVALSASWTAAGVWVRKRARTIALYRLSGAEPALVARQHAVVLALAAVPAAVLGAGLGLGMALAATGPAAALLPLAPGPAVVAVPALTAAAVVLLGVAGAALPALDAAARVRPGAAMRSGEAAAPAGVAATAAGAGLLVLAVLAAVLRLPSLELAVQAALGLVAAAGALGAAAVLTSRAAARTGSRRFVPATALRALADRRATLAKTLAVGIGIAGVTAVVAVRASLDESLQRELPRQVPALVLIDIQPDQRDAVGDLARAAGATGFEAEPNLRAVITAVDGRPAREAVVDRSERWVIEGDRSLSWRAAPAAADLLAGTWWPADYDGPPLVSVGEDVAEAFALGPGATLTYRVFGREITARVANVREEDHRSFGIDYLLIGSPRPLADAPHGWIASVEGSDAAIDRFVGRLAETAPNVTAVDVRLLVAEVRRAIDGAGLATLAVAGVLLATGALAMAAVVAGDADARGREALVFALVGASRREIGAARWAETLATGAVAAALGGGAGLLGGWWLADAALRIDYRPGTPALLLPAVLGLAAGAVAGAGAGLGAVPRGRGEIARRLST